MKKALLLLLLLLVVVVVVVVALGEGKSGIALLVISCE